MIMIRKIKNKIRNIKKITIIFKLFISSSLLNKKTIILKKQKNKMQYKALLTSTILKKKNNNKTLFNNPSTKIFLLNFVVTFLIKDIF